MGAAIRSWFLVARGQLARSGFKRVILGAWVGAASGGLLFWLPSDLKVEGVILGLALATALSFPGSLLTMKQVENYSLDYVPSGFALWLSSVALGYIQWFVLLPGVISLAIWICRKVNELQKVSKLTRSKRLQLHSPASGSTWLLLVWLSFAFGILLWWFYQLKFGTFNRETETIVAHLLAGIGFPTTLLVLMVTNVWGNVDDWYIFDYLSLVAIGYLQWFKLFPMGVSWMSRMSLWLWRWLVPSEVRGRVSRAKLSESEQSLRVMWLAVAVPVSSLAMVTFGDKETWKLFYYISIVMSFPVGWLTGESLEEVFNWLDHGNILLGFVVMLLWFLWHAGVVIAGYWQWFILVPRVRALVCASRREEEGDF